MANSQSRPIPIWLQALLGLASICVIGGTIAVIVVAAVVLPGAADNAEERLESHLQELVDDLEESVETALEPTNDSVKQLDESLGGELREMLDRIDDLEERLRAIRDVLDEINIRDAEALLEQRRAQDP